MTRILLVDDNPAVRRYLRAILEQQESWQVCGEARTGAEALHQVLEAPPDLIVLDYQMPDLNGVDVAKQISELFPKIPILMVTLHLSRQLADAARKRAFEGRAPSRTSVRWWRLSMCFCMTRPTFPLQFARADGLILVQPVVEAIDAKYRIPCIGRCKVANVSLGWSICALPSITGALWCRILRTNWSGCHIFRRGKMWRIVWSVSPQRN